jgi:rod shape-determining protein MreD
MYLILGIPLILLSSILETSLISRYQLLHGTADIVMLIVLAWALQEKTKGAWVWAVFAGLIMSLFTGLPFFVPLAAYLLITWFAKLLHRRIWQMPLLVMLALTLVGTILDHALSLVTMSIKGLQFSWASAITQITLPSILLNLLWALPIYWLITAIANRMYPKLEEV